MAIFKNIKFFRKIIRVTVKRAKKRENLKIRISEKVSLLALFL
jgi:hypothetical protein